MRQILLLLPLLSLALPLSARPQSGFYANPEVDELRVELDDLKHALHTTQMELGLLEERLKKQDTALAGFKGQSAGKQEVSLSLLSSQVSSLEKKVNGLEKTLEKAATDLRTLSTSVSSSLAKIDGLENGLSSHDKRLEEVSKLKGTLTSISKAIGQRSAPEATVVANSTTYRVKAGDSLEKIARIHRTTADALRKINRLSNDKIVIGQELRLPDGSS